LHNLGFRNVNYLGRGVDNQLFSPHHRSDELRRSWNVKQDDLVALYVGRIAPEKNLDLAIATFRTMKLEKPAMRFIIVGDGPICSMQRQANPDLMFCGTKTDHELARYYASADLFLFPSETETFGNVTLEAMASGLAVVAYNYAAAKMHIKHGQTGMLAPYGDSQAFTEVALHLIRTSQLIPAIRRSARESVTAVGWAPIVDRFETLLGACARQSDPHAELRSRRKMAA
jgi:glycosyltransferase involved in cell wall biosynthesis